MRTKEWPLDVRWSDLDLLGHVNNIVYAEYFMDARVEYTSEFRELYQKLNVGTVVVQANYSYKVPALYPSKLKVITTTEKLGNTSMTMLHQLVGRDHDTLYCEAYVTMVWVDRETNKPVPIDEEVKDWLTKD